MASIKNAFGNHAINVTEISNLIGDRFYYKRLPNNPTYPCSSYQVIVNNTHHDIDFSYPRIQVDHFGKNPVIDVSKAFLSEFKRFKGYLNPADENIPVKQIEIIDAGSDPPFEENNDLYRIIQEFRIIYQYKE